MKDIFESLMRFKTEQERMQHPQASLIPVSIWRDKRLFNGTLSPVVLSLMQWEGNSAVQTLINEPLAYEGLVENEKRSAWLAIAISHNYTSFQQLQQVSSCLQLTSQELLELAVVCGNMDFFQFLLHKSLLSKNSYRFISLFSIATKYGHKAILEYMTLKAPDRLDEMITKGNYSAFLWAAENGHMAVLEYLERKCSDKLYEKMITVVHFNAFWKAAANGHKAVLEYLVEKAPANLYEKMMTAGYSCAFHEAAINGHLDVLEYLEEKAPDKLQELIAVGNYYPFRYAAKYGHEAILNYLALKAPDKLEEMIATNTYSALSNTAQRGNKDLIQRWLEFPNVFAYAEQHDHEYGSKYIYPFVQQKLEALKTRKAAFEQTTPNGLFDTDNAEEAKLLFYVLRNLIRRNAATLQDDIIFLLEIPAVKAMAHTEVTSGQANELLRLALSLNNQFAATRLLQLPLVRELAERNDFYREEMRGGLDLAALARNAESSMTALTQGEEQRLAAALGRYAPMLDAAGVSNIMQELKETLEQRYSEHPARLIRDKQETIILPQDWQDFLKLTLSKNGSPDEASSEVNRALRAYYQNPNHTAWRYLSKPNPWMHASASYVYVNPDNTDERWSTFEEYASLISVFYLAAIDSTVPPMEGHTFETRLEHFINELAHIGRTHNWEKSRLRHNGSQTTKEEYDDLQADRPSCFSGVKRRLFQSVLGHPLLEFLTKDKVEQEIRDFVREHFKNSINDSNKAAIAAAWNQHVTGEDMTPEDWACLKQVDISPEQQQQLISKLSQKYGDQFNDFVIQIEDAFKLQPKHDAHILSFGYTQPEQFFIEKSSCDANTLTNSYRFFPQEERNKSAITKNDNTPNPV